MPSSVFKALIVAAAMGSAACGASPAPTKAVAPKGAVQARAAKDPVQVINVAQAKARIEAEKELVVIDVREPGEFAEGHIGVAQLKPLGQLDSWAAGLKKDAHYLMVCRSGNRSGQASQRLAAMGFTHITNMAGGMMGWTAAGFPVVK